VVLAAASRTINVSTSLSNLTNDFSSACGTGLWGVHTSGQENGNGTLTSNISPTSNNPKIALVLWSSQIPGTCTQSVSFIARTTGLDTPHITNYDNLICGLVTDGLFSKLDVLHIYATQNSTIALLNLVSTNYTGVANGSPAFTADRGFLGVDNSTTVYIDSGFNPVVGSPNYTDDAAHISAWSLTNAQAVNGGTIIGRTLLSSNQTNLLPKFSDGKAYFRVNNGSGTAGVLNSDSRGHFVASRTAVTTLAGYLNAVNILSNTSSSVAMPNDTFKTLAQGAGSGTVNSGGGYQLAMASIGGPLSPTDVTNFYNRLRTYMTAVGVP
jgi:hypothetical protein